MQVLSDVLSIVLVWLNASDLHSDTAGLSAKCGSQNSFITSDIDSVTKPLLPFRVLSLRFDCSLRPR